MSSLTQLSIAAQDASRACIEFYQVANISGEPPVFGLPSSVSTIFAPATASSAVQTTAEPTKKRAKKGDSEPSAEDGDNEDAEDGEDGKAERRKRRKKDPNAPRRPQTVYFAFANEARKLIRDEFTSKGIEATNTDIIREVAERWKHMSEEEKEPWKTIYADQIKKYDTLKAQYNADKEHAIANGLPLPKSADAAVPRPKPTPKVKPAAVPVPSSPVLPSPVPVPVPQEPAEAPALSPSKRKKKSKKEAADVASSQPVPEPVQAAPAASPVAVSQPTPKEKKKRNKKRASEAVGSEA